MDQLITVRKAELLEHLRTNRDRHRDVFLQALDGYRQHALGILEERIKDLSAGKLPDIRITLAVPEDHTRDYDRIIKMVEMNIGDTFELDEQQFAQFVMDDWHWQRQFIATAGIYAGHEYITRNYGENASK